MLQNKSNKANWTNWTPDARGYRTGKALQDAELQDGQGLQNADATGRSEPYRTLTLQDGRSPTKKKRVESERF